MATKVYSSGAFIVIEQNSLPYNINKSSFDFSFNSGQVVFLDNSNSTSVTDLFTNIQDENGTQVGTTQELIQNYILSISSSSIVVSGSATEAKQTDQINQATNYFSKKAIGRTIDLTADVSAAWSGYPLQFTASQLDAFTFRINNVFYDVPNDVQINTVEDLVSILNANQNYLVFSAIDSTNLAVNSGSLSVVDLEEFYIRTANFGSLFYDTFTASAAVALSNLDEINEKLNKLNKQVELLQEIADELTHHHNLFTSSNQGTGSLSLPNANTNYFVAAFRLKAGFSEAHIDSFRVKIQSLSNDNLRLRIGVNINISFALNNTHYSSVAADSAFEVARPGVNGVPTVASNPTVTGLGSGRYIFTDDILAGGEGVFNQDTILAVSGVVFYVCVEPRTGGATVYDSENWTERTN